MNRRQFLNKLLVGVPAAILALRLPKIKMPEPWNGWVCHCTAWSPRAELELAPYYGKHVLGYGVHVLEEFGGAEGSLMVWWAGDGTFWTKDKHGNWQQEKSKLVKSQSKEQKTWRNL